MDNLIKEFVGLYLLFKSESCWGYEFCSLITGLEMSRWCYWYITLFTFFQERIHMKFRFIYYSNNLMLLVGDRKTKVNIKSISIDSILKQ